jgi:hypothetical protein
MYYKTTKQFLVSVNTTIYYFIFLYFNLDDYMFPSLDHHQAIFRKHGLIMVK